MAEPERSGKSESKELPRRDDYEKAIKETVRVLRLSGKLIVTLLNRESSCSRDSFRDSNWHVHGIKQTDLKLVEDAVAEHFSFWTDYFLDIESERIFESQDAAHAALYIISEVKQPHVKGKKT